MKNINRFLQIKTKLKYLLLPKQTVSKLWIDWLHDYKKLKYWTDKRALERRMALGEKYIFPFIGNKHPNKVTVDDIVL